MLRTIQIALVGGNNDAIAVGLRNFPTNKLALLCRDGHRTMAEELRAPYERVLKIPIDIYTVQQGDVKTVLEVIGSIISKEKEGYKDFVLNVGGGDRSLTCAGTTATFVYGIKAFEVMGEQQEMLPVLKLSYSDVISEVKMEILGVIDRAGGAVAGLEELGALSGYGKPLLSYHINGGEDSRGLIDLGLVEIERNARGKPRVKITPLGKVLLLSCPQRLPT